MLFLFGNGVYLVINRAEEYKKRLEMYYQAEEAILGGAQSYSMGSRNLTRANLAEVRSTIEYLIKQIEVEEARAKGKGKMKVMGGVPRDI